MFGLESYSLELKHYVILSILGLIEVVLFTLMFYNCYLEYRERIRGRKYKYKDNINCGTDGLQSSAKIGVYEEKPTIMEIFSVDMTLKRDTSNNTIK